MASSTNHVRRLNLGWLTGPIFEKELRVSSRRRRNFALRFFYIALLTVFVAMVWLSVVHYHGSVGFLQSRMAAAGKQIIVTVAFFQFVTTQVLAVIMLSTAISNEVYHRTLGLLMTTPINSLQIVMGKMLSKLLQLILLLAITLPILAIVRVFGGVSWSYLLSSLCITLTAVLLAGSVSLAFSIRNRRAYAVILKTAFVLGAAYFVLPGALGTLTNAFMPILGGIGHLRGVFTSNAAVAMLHLNPFLAMWQVTEVMMSPGGRAIPFSWPVHCIFMLGLSVVVLAWSMKVVRKTALRQATGQLDPLARARKKASRANPTSDSLDGPIKRVIGPPIVWKELRTPFIQGLDNRNSYIGLLVAVAALCVTYLATARQGALDESYSHVSYGLLFVLMGIIFGVVFSATRVTSERESQTWLLLLTTSLGDWDILLGKAVSAFRRCLPIWGLLAGHVLLFIFVGYIHPIVAFHLLPVAVSVSFFVVAVGLYFSSRFGRTTSSVIASFGLLLALWAAGPVFAGVLGTMTKKMDLFVAYMMFHPAIQTELILNAAGGAQNADLPPGSLVYAGERVIFGINQEAFGIWKMTGILAGTALVYIAVGMLFLWRAKCLLRRSLF
jgi:ABC-type transport system involved in multi-copper enzyme maturation permease subunit